MIKSSFCKFLFFFALAFGFTHLCFALPNGYKNIKLGMSVEEVKKVLKADSDFGYRGERDVSLAPENKQVLIETDASKNPYSFFTRCWFQFVDEKLFSITLNLNEEKLDHASVFSSLVKKYGNPTSINPKKSVWENDSVCLSLERPLTLKYLDNTAFKKMQDASSVQKTYEEKAIDDFLESL
ncbi:hypothetical protein [Treponema pectinovorum]|uniref:hypothetical protein n=1 Tax=Treponema pectinovorum TaxID=164 RepID=UPI0011F2C506|nr:hypothetical protein [Treponema pectinovorum]